MVSLQVAFQLAESAFKYYHLWLLFSYITSFLHPACQLMSFQFCFIFSLTKHAASTFPHSIKKKKNGLFENYLTSIFFQLESPGFSHVVCNEHRLYINTLK